VFGLILGGILGIFDGLSALVSAPEVAPQIVGILIGYFARKVHSLPLGLLFGLAVGAVLAYGIVALQIAQGGKAYYLPIMLPGAALGLIVGYATQRHAERASSAAVSRH
jgi:hypothetical protein